MMLRMGDSQVENGRPVFSLKCTIRALAAKYQVGMDLVFSRWREAFAEKKGGISRAIMWDDGTITVPLIKGGQLKLQNFNISDSTYSNLMDTLPHILENDTQKEQIKKFLRIVLSNQGIVRGVVIERNNNHCVLSLLSDIGEPLDGIYGLLYLNWTATKSDQRAEMYEKGMQLHLSFLGCSSRFYQHIDGSNFFTVARNNRRWLWGVLEDVERFIHQTTGYLVVYCIGKVDFAKGTMEVYCYDKLSMEISYILVDKFGQQGIKATVKLSPGKPSIIRRREAGYRCEYGLTGNPTQSEASQC